MEAKCFLCVASATHFFNIKNMFYTGNKASLSKKGAKNVADYEKMYYMLFNDITDVIEALIKVQQKAEEMYILSTDEEN